MGQYDSERTRVTQIHRAEGHGDEPAKPGEACIIVIYGPELGKRLQLGTAPFAIGRSSKSDLFLDQESVSRNHARISFDGTHYWVADLQSTNGTFVNDEPVREQRLRDGDQVRVGRSILKFMTGENVEMHYHEEIYRLMTVDGLTQVYNRRYFNEALEREYNRSKRYDRALSLIAFDIDHFKKCNDTYGHLAGDNLLRLMSTAVKARLRREDIFARTGGEEFVVIFPATGIRASVEAIRRLQNELARSAFAHESHQRVVTFSGGAAEWREGEALSDLLERADAAMYNAKHQGKNQVAVAA